MEDTLERSLESILGQLDEHYEVVIADDGSSDGSVQVIKQMQQHYNNLRLIELKRDRKRRLGLTRNIAIKEALGEYVLLHLDCDDVYAPYLKGFVAAFHQIEEAIEHDILLSGQHINMSRKDFLLGQGPYENIFRGEDRNLWVRMASIGAYIPFDHVDFCTRLPKIINKGYSKAIIYTWDHFENDFRSGAKFREWFSYEIIKKRAVFNWKLQILRIILGPLAYISSKFKEPFAAPPKNMDKPEKFAEYRKQARGTLGEILGRYNRDVDWSKISPDAKHIFE